MKERVFLSGLVTGALCLVIGFAAGALLLRPDAEETKATSDVKETKAVQPQTTANNNRPVAPAHKSSELTHRDIIYSARYAVTQCLKSPRSASFPIWSDGSYSVTKLENNAYMVSGIVMAKNSFGVELQNNWNAKVQFSGPNLESVRATYIKVGNEVLLNDP